MIITPDNATESFNVKADGELVTRVVEWNSDDKTITRYSDNFPITDTETLKPEHAQLVSIKTGEIKDEW